ncbi:MAG: hypothetical protein ACE5JM_12590 [Armatimonadota bacterium]
MIHSTKVRLAAIGVALLLVAGLALAQGYGTKPAAKAPAATAGGIEATVTGRNYCIGCALKSKGAASQCSVYGHRHVLDVTKAVGADGKTLAGSKKWVLHYLENDQSKDVVKGHHGETLEIKGKVYPRERVLEVVSYKPVTAGAKAARPKAPEGT